MIAELLETSFKGDKSCWFKTGRLRGLHRAGGRAVAQGGYADAPRPVPGAAWPAAVANRLTFLVPAAKGGGGA